MPEMPRAVRRADLSSAPKNKRDRRRLRRAKAALELWYPPAPHRRLVEHLRRQRDRTIGRIRR